MRADNRDITPATGVRQDAADSVAADSVVAEMAARQLRATVREAPAVPVVAPGLAMAGSAVAIAAGGHPGAALAETPALPRAAAAAPPGDDAAHAAMPTAPPDGSARDAAPPPWAPQPGAPQPGAPQPEAPQRWAPRADAVAAAPPPGSAAPPVGPVDPAEAPAAVLAGVAAPALPALAVPGDPPPQQEPPPTTAPADIAPDAASAAAPTDAGGSEEPPPPADPVAPQPLSLTVEAAVGREDGRVDLAIVLRHAGGEAEISIAGLPAGARLSAGRPDAEGVWHLAPDELAGLVLLPSPDWSGAAGLRVRVATADGIATARLPVTVAGIADAPVAAARDAAGIEDRAIALDLGAALADSDGSETLAVAILGLPDGARLSAGTRQADGAWHVAADALAGLMLTPPPDFAGTLALTLRVTSTEAANGDAAISSADFAVQVTPRLEAGATLTAGGSGEEDGWIAIRAEFATPDTDGSERLGETIRIEGVPPGAVLQGGTALGSGGWSVPTAALLAGRIAIRPPTDSDGTLRLTLHAVAEDRAGAEVVNRPLVAIAEIRVAARADAPVVAARDAAGIEDRAIALDLGAALADRDGSETLAVAILGLPDGARLSAGTRQADGAWHVAADALAGLMLTPPPDFAGTLALTLRVTSTEAANGDAAISSADFAVQIRPQADAARIIAGGDGAEDAWIPIRGSLATTDADGSERLGPTVTVSGVPGGGALNHGTEIAPGVWSVPRELFEAGALAIRPPPQSDADITLRLAVTTLDGDAAGVTEAAVSVVVRAVADAPSVQVADAHGMEDTPIRLAGLGGALADTDGSETLAFVITGMPAGASLSAGTRQADGSWALTPAQLAGASITPPAQFSGSFALTLTAVATEARDGAAPARTAARFTVAVDPVADAGSIAGNSTGNEDSAITIRPGFATPDTDGSETWSATSLVSGIPAGASLTRGTAISAGVWEVATAELRAGSIALRPPANSDADITLTIRATLTDSGNGMAAARQVTGSHRVVVRAVADAPVVAASDVAGAEDQPIALALAARLTDTDGSERLSLVLNGVPAGATLSAGTRNADGSWTIPPDALAGLAMTPPRDFSGTINLTLRATAQDNDSSSASGSVAFAVRVAAVADAPALRVGPAAGAEDSAIALRISGRTTDLDGSERLVGFRLLDLPDGAVLRAGGAALLREADGSVLVAAGDAPSLTVTAPPHADADFTLRVAAIAEEPNGSRAESPPQALPVRIDAVADAPVWLRIGGAGREDSAIPLDLAARLEDTDGSERLFFVVSGLPAGAVLNVGTYRGPGSWSLTADEAAIATLTPPPDFAGTISLTVSAIAQESAGGQQAVATVRFPVAVTAVLDTGGWVAQARGAEDSPIVLNLAPPLRDGDGSERLVGSVLVEGVPPGAVLRLADGSLPEGTAGSFRIPVERLAGVTLTMPRDSDAAVRLAVTATVEDSGGLRDTVRGTVTVDPAGVADTPWLEAADSVLEGHAGKDADAGWGSLKLGSALADTDGSETLHVWVRDVPRGFVLSAGTPAGDGTWLLRAADLDGLQLRPPAGFDGAVKLRVEAVAAEREGGAASASQSLVVTVRGGGGDRDGDGRDGNGGGTTPLKLAVTAQDTREDNHAALVIQVAPADASNAMLGLRVAGLPAGARLSAGIEDAEGGAWILRADELDGLQVIPPADFAGAIALRIVAIAQSRDGDVTTSESRAEMRFEAVADGARIAAAPPAGTEDAAIPLNLAVAGADADGSERVIAITLSGLPSGASIAPAAGVRNNGDGTWSVEPDAAGAVRFIPPPQAHGSFALTVTATTQEASNGATATVSRGISVSVAPHPDAPVATAADATGREDRPIALGLSAVLVDRDGSEALSVVIAGLPEGAILSAGVNNGDGSWTLAPAQLAGLAVTAPKDWSGSMALRMQAHAMERATGAVATTEVHFRVGVAGVADAPLVDAAAVSAGAEDRAIALDIIARLADADGSERLLVVVSGVPAGARLSAGSLNADGSWTVPGEALPGLGITPPPNYAGTLRLDAAAMAVEADGDSTAIRFQIAVTVDPVADAPLLVLAGVSGNEDSAIRLPLAATLTDTDGSEAIARFLVSGLPPGATLSAGTRAGDVWTLTPDQAATVTLRPPAHFSGDLSLSVTAVSREAANGAEALATATLPVTVLPVADAALLTAANASGTEDHAVTLSLAAALADTDGSESFGAISLGGLPPGFALSAGTAAGDGSWVLARSELAGLRLRAPADWNGTVTLTLAATTQDGDTTARASRSVSVTIAAVNDAPVLTLSPAAAAAVGQERARAVADATLADIDSPMMGGASVTLAGGAPGERLVFEGFAEIATGGRIRLGDSGLEVTRGADGSVTLSGAAPSASYERVLEALALEQPGGGLAAGTRTIGVTLRDSAGAAAATQLLALRVDPSRIEGAGTDALLGGTPGHDTIIGSAGDETMLAGAGADLFVVAMGGGSDRVDGGAGSWLDTLHIQDAGAPGAGGWTLMLDGAPAVVAGERSFDFAEPVSGRVQFEDGSAVELAQIERITW